MSWLVGQPRTALPSFTLRLFGLSRAFSGFMLQARTDRQQPCKCQVILPTSPSYPYEFNC